MAVGTKDLASDSLRSFGDDRLVDELRKSKEELFNLRFQSATGQLDNHGRLRAVKRDISRIYTEMRERELGIGLPPAAPKAPAVVTEVDAKAEKKAKKADKADKAPKAEKAPKGEKAAKAEKAAGDEPSDEQDEA
ncbi:50S ribosomal protein L29 [Dermatophilaceae bacterium Soc4.6]